MRSRVSEGLFLGSCLLELLFKDIKENLEGTHEIKGRKHCFVINIKS